MHPEVQAVEDNAPIQYTRMYMSSASVNPKQQAGSPVSMSSGQCLPGPQYSQAADLYSASVPLRAQSKEVQKASLTLKGQQWSF